MAHSTNTSISSRSHSYRKTGRKSGNIIFQDLFSFTFTHSNDCWINGCAAQTRLTKPSYTIMVEKTELKNLTKYRYGKRQDPQHINSSQIIKEFTHSNVGLVVKPSYAIVGLEEVGDITMVRNHSSIT